MTVLIVDFAIHNLDATHTQSPRELKTRGVLSIHLLSTQSPEQALLLGQKAPR